MGTVYLGTPLQMVRALFDTGSANTWVFSSQAKKLLPTKDKKIHKFYAYDSSKSTTAGKPDPKSSVLIKFGSG